MTPSELDTYRQKLLELGKGVRTEVHTIAQEAFRQAGGEAAGNLSNVPFHPGDLASDNYEHETSLGLLENEVQIQQEISEALERIEQGTYGRCQECGREIDKERLDALPYTAYCLKDAERIQAEQMLLRQLPGEMP